jgi:hypothetical protein
MANKPWYEMTADELIAAGHKPVQIQHTEERGWEEVKPQSEEDNVQG